MKSFAKHLIVLSLLSSLVACGGGGGSSTTPAPTPSPSPSPGPTAFIDTVAANTTVVAPTYADADRAAAFNTLNTARLSAGLGLLRQESHLDAAAQAHADYLTTNNTYGHYETSGSPGFTGVYPADRVLAAGYSLYLTTGEEASVSTGPMDGATHVNGLLATPYHRMGMFKYRTDEVGIGYSAASINNLVINNGRNPGQGAPSSLTVVWPVNGATNVRTTGDVEEPDPIPENAGSPYGYPISIHTHELKVLTVTSFTLTYGGGSTVSTKLLSYASDLNLSSTYNVRYFAALIPRSPLASGTTYTATFVGQIDGVDVTKTWTFTTQ